MAAGALQHSDLDTAEARSVARDLGREQQLDLLYVSPERLLTNGTLDRLSRLRLALFAIDEAHCVSQWGHEFRPEYRSLTCLADRFPGVPRVALTATADPRTRDDILRALRMETAETFVASFHRPNLRIAAAAKVGETAQLLDLLGAPLRRLRHRLLRHARQDRACGGTVRAEGPSAIAFHAGLDAETKRAAHARFRSGEAVVVVATIAFGMGIDRPDVRFVVHLDMPDGPEASYQQIGRAGRDGDPGETLLYCTAGKTLPRHATGWRSPRRRRTQKRVMRTKLEEMIALTEAATCRTQSLLACFGEELPDPCGHCDNCAAPPRMVDATVEAQKVLSAVYAPISCSARSTSSPCCAAKPLTA